MRVEGEKAAVIYVECWVSWMIILKESGIVNVHRTFSRIVSSIGVVEVEDILVRRVLVSGEKRRRESRPGALRRGSIDGSPQLGRLKGEDGLGREVSLVED